MGNTMACPPSHKTFKPCYAVWYKDDTEWEYWEWCFDEEHKEYVDEDTDDVITPALLLSMMQANINNGMHMVPRQVHNDSYEASLCGS